jgi:hypothetical protein
VNSTEGIPVRKLLFSFFVFAAGLIVFFPSSVSVAQSQNSQVAQSQDSYLENENLPVTMPQDFKIGYKSSHDSMYMQEWVRKNETVDNWSELITIEIVYGKHFDTGLFLKMIGGRWLTDCPGSKPNNIYTGQANGYKVSMFILNCPLNPKTMKPENTTFRAIQGNDSFYLVQWATKFDITPEQRENITKFFSTVNVCDTRTSEHPCPDLKAQGFKKIE